MDNKRISVRLYEKTDVIEVIFFRGWTRSCRTFWGRKLRDGCCEVYSKDSFDVNKGLVPDFCGRENLPCEYAVRFAESVKELYGGEIKKEKII